MAVIYFVYVWECARIWMCACLGNSRECKCACIRAQACRSLRLMMGVFLCCSPHYSLRQGLSTETRARQTASEMASLLQRCPVCLSGVQSQVGHHTWPVWKWVLGIQALVFTCGCVLAEPSLQPWRVALLFTVTVGNSLCALSALWRRGWLNEWDSSHRDRRLSRKTLAWSSFSASSLPITGSVHPVDPLSAGEIIAKVQGPQFFSL